MAHTPGPWVAIYPGMDYLVKASDGRTFLVGDGVYHPENEANARLIAAAPELLEACRFAFGMLTGSRTDHPQVLTAAVSAAIAKAEGRASEVLAAQEGTR